MGCQLVLRACSRLRVSLFRRSLSSTLSISRCECKRVSQAIKERLGIITTSGSVGDIQYVSTGQSCWRTNA